MNAIVPTGASQGGLIPHNMSEAMQLAEMMSRGKMMPEHLRNPGDALMVVEQAMRWNMSPFAVAQSTFNIKGKLLFAGIIVAAAIENSSAISGLLDYQFSGEGASRKITVSATRRGETQPRTIEVSLKDARTTNDIWNKQPDQQLVYHGVRVWARRWTPGVILGVYTPEEWPATARDTFSGTTIDATPERPVEAVQSPSLESTQKESKTFLERAAYALGKESHGSRWLKLLMRVTGEAPSMDDVVAIRDLPSVVTALEKAPTLIQAQINEAFVTASQRLAMPSPDEGESEDVVTDDDGWPGPDPDKMKEEAAP